MAIKELKTRGRKALSLLLTMTMVISMLQVGVFAYENQVMDGHFAVDENGVATLIVDENGDVITQNSGTVTEDGYTLTKSLRQTGENKFEITLQVQTSQTITTTASKAATVLVIDLSNSMNDDMDSSTRMVEARKVAQDFLKSYAGTDPGAQQYISVVWFGSYGGVDKDWVNVAGGEGKNSYDDIYSYLGNLSAPHSGDTGGTNLERGLYEALQQLNERSNIVEQKNVVVITDGRPTYRGTGDQLSGTGSSGSEANNNAAISQAETIKAGDATVYTVCIAAENDVCYDGTDIHVCEHCNETRDQHVKEELCRNCGEDRSAHTKSQYGNWYKCPNNNNRDYWNALTYYYCDSEKTLQYSDKVVSGDVTVGYFLSNDIASSPANAFNASTSADLDAALKAIASSIEATGYTGEGTSVTDPMGDYIVLGDVSVLEGSGVSSSDGVLTWALDPEKATDVDEVTNEDGSVTKIYTYSVTYPIVLDVAARGFRAKDEDGATKYYPTNGYTYLSVPQDNGEIKKIAFRVPGVRGEIPEMPWRIEYYLQDNATLGDYDNYTQADADDRAAVDVWTSVEAPEGYADKYRSRNYEFESGNVKMEITPTGENVMKLYYKHITASVLVNHFYKTDYIRVDGTEEPGAYPETAQKSSKHSQRIETPYEAVPELTYDQGSYELVDSDPRSGQITVDVDSDKNVINLYYSRLIDEREPTSARVEHVYASYEYQLVDGKYEIVETGSKTEVAEEAAEARATAVFNVSAEPLVGYEEYTINPDRGDYAVLAANGMSFTLVKDPAENVRTLYFDKIGEEPAAIDVTVNHHYTKVVTTVEDGVVVTETIENSTGTTYPAYVGERFETGEVNSYGGEVYTSDSENAGKLVIDELSESVTIDLYYTLEVEPEKAGLIVNHHYISFTEVTREVTEEVSEEVVTEVTDPETGEVTTTTETVTKTVVVGTETITEENTDHEILGIEVNDLYVGESYTAPQIQWNGYTFHEDDSNPTGIAGEDGVLDLYYYYFGEEDEREYAEIDVQHNYVTHLETIVGGKVDTVTTKDGSVTEHFPVEGNDMRAGDEFMATANPSYNENEYTQITEKSVLGPVILQGGTNSTIVIDYERSISDLVETRYVVKYEYHTYNMSIDENGVATLGEAYVTYGDTVVDSGYVGEIVSFPSGAKEGYSALPTNPATTQVLGESGNEWTLVYEQKNYLDKGSVVVNHHYETVTIAIDGTSSSTGETVSGSSVEKYLGESYSAAAVPNGYELVGVKVDAAAVETAEVVSVSVGENTVIDFYYTKTIDNSILAPYSISHRYFLYDWDGSLLSGPAEDQEPDITGSAYVTTFISAAPESSDYELVSASYNEEALPEWNGSAYSIEVQEGSNNVVFVYEKVLPRDLLSVTVIHNYYEDEAAIAEGAEPLEKFHDTASDIPEGEAYTAEIRNAEGYSFYAAEPDTMTVRVTDNADHVIILNYIRAGAVYEVIHVYNTNGREDGRTSETFGGFHGDVVSASSIAQVTGYNGNNYSFSSVSGDVTLDSEAVQTIVLTYNRSVYVPTPTPDPDPDPRPEPTPDPIPEPVIVPDPEPIDIPEEDVPLAELPEEDIPLAEVPETGDPMVFYGISAALSGLGLAWLGLKKKEDEEA